MTESFGLSDPGRVRKNNEDFLLVSHSKQLYVVADGMGGAQAGETASKLAAETVLEVLNERPIPTLKDLEEAEAVDKALDQFHSRRNGKNQGANSEYDVKELTKAMLGVQSKSSSAGQREMLNKLEGDLEFLNHTLGSTPQN